MPETVQQLSVELKSGVETLYRGRLRGLYLYGSYARGEQTCNSDLDVLIVLDRIDSHGAEIDRTSQLVSSLSLQSSISISRVFAPDQRPGPESSHGTPASRPTRSQRFGSAPLNWSLDFEKLVTSNDSLNDLDVFR